MNIYVCSLKVAHDCAVKYKPYSIISFVDNINANPFFLNYTKDRHLILQLNDINLSKSEFLDDYKKDCARLIQFLSYHDMRYPMLIHCTLGVSRSTATAYIALNLYKENQEFEIAQYLREKIPYAAPNLSLIHIADQLLGREGRMLSAIKQLALPKIIEGKGYKALSTDFF